MGLGGRWRKCPDADADETLIAVAEVVGGRKTIEFYREDRPIIFGSIWLIDLDGSLRRVNSSENAHIDEQNEIG